MQRQRKAGNPTHHGKSARTGQPATPPIVPNAPELYLESRRGRATRRDDDLRRNFEAGFYVGLLVGLVILCAVLFLWAIPTVDGCVASLNAMQGVSA